MSAGRLQEVAFFDIYPSSNSASFSGTWGNYPFFPRGVVAVSGIGEGLFILRPNLLDSTQPPSNVTAADLGTNQIDLDWDPVPGATEYLVKRAVGGCGGTFVDFATTPTPDFSDVTVSGNETYGYIVQASQPIGCESDCVEVTATGECLLMPDFPAAGQAAGGSVATPAVQSHIDVAAIPGPTKLYFYNVVAMCGTTKVHADLT